MLPSSEKPRITEIKVRMDCNGCVQKIRKALHGITGIYEIYIDFPQQKLTVIGWADPEKVMKAIKKTRKLATICTHPDSGEAAGSEPPAPAADGPPNPSPPEAGNPQPPAENPQPPAENPPPADATNPPAAEPTQEQPPPPPPPPENPVPEVAPSVVATDNTASLPSGTNESKVVEVIHVIDHRHDYRYNTHYQGGHGFQHNTPHYVSYSYKPAVYVPEYGYVPSPLRNSRYTRVEYYSDDYPHRVDGNSNNITSMFSDENPNACCIV